MKTVFTLLLFLLVISSFAQTGSLTLHGRVESNGKIQGNVSIEVIRNHDSIIEVSTKGNGKYNFKLELGSIYNITFSKDGYFNKSVEVIGISPEGEKVSGKYKYQLDIELLTRNSVDTNETVLPPIVRLFILNDNKGFIYNSDYNKWATEIYNNIKK